MKKSVLAITAVLVLTISGLALAEMEKGKEMMGEHGMGMKGGGMKGEMMGKGGMMGHGMMMKMMEQSVVATSDGGIVIVSANKISKYDKDLNLVKEVELKMPTMEEMQKMCPMMGKGMMGDMKEDSSKGNAPGESTSVDEHAGHHPESK